MWRSFVVSAACLASPAVAWDGPDPPVAARADEPEYARTLDKRASEVLLELKLADPEVAGRVRATIIDQYRGLRALHDARDAKVRDLRGRTDLDEAGRAAGSEAERAATEAAASALNDRFLAALARDLAPAQVETVQDKMTYHKLQVTYNAYLEMLPRLTPAQKKVVFDTLKQARDHAVYAGSAEEKTSIFDRSKGRVNNYLSKEGYDLKLAAKEWAERRKAAK